MGKNKEKSFYVEGILRPTLFLDLYNKVARRSRDHEINAFIAALKPQLFLQQIATPFLCVEYVLDILKDVESVL